MPQAVAATGQVLLHRFYCKESLTVYDVKVGCIEGRCVPREFEFTESVFEKVDNERLFAFSTGNCLHLYRISFNNHCDVNLAHAKTEQCIIFAARRHGCHVAGYQIGGDASIIKGPSPCVCTH
jgi:hypothetical protein